MHKTRIRLHTVLKIREELQLRPVILAYKKELATVSRSQLALTKLKPGITKKL